MNRKTRGFAEKLSELRNVSFAAVEAAILRGLLTFSPYQGEMAWRYGDARNWCWRRLDGKPYSMKDGPAKALSGTSGPAWHYPIGLDDVTKFDRRDVLVCEGSPDGLAAFHFAGIEGVEDIGVLVMLGDGAKVADLEASRLTGRRVRIFGDATPSGQQAAERWAAQFQGYAAEVQLFDLSGLVRADGKPAKDLNDIASICASDFEASPDLAAITRLDVRGKRVRTLEKARRADRAIAIEAIPYTEGTEYTEGPEVSEHAEVPEDPMKGGEGGAGKSILSKSKTEGEARPCPFTPNAVLNGLIASNRGQTNKLLLRIARRIMAAEAVGGKEQSSLRAACVAAWIDKSRLYIDPELTEETVGLMLAYKLTKAKRPDTAWLATQVDLSTLPPVDHPVLSNGSKLELLARYCRLKASTNSAFAVTVREAASVIGLSDLKNVSLYLRRLEQIPVLKCQERGIPAPNGGKATIYLWMGPITQ